LAACPHGSQVEYETLPQERYRQRDDWGISVGGSGMDGSYLQTNTVFPQLTNTFSFSSGGTDGGFSASFGNDMDLIAPATVGLIMTTISQDNFTSNICHENDILLFNYIIVLMAHLRQLLMSLVQVLC
jgi:hypothetical protein